MEDLNKQQLVLLVLLISFVTSIATGIITVSLLSKAPVEVTQTINRVVERTVETVVPDSLEPQKVVTVRETVVVTEEERVVEAISKNSGKIIRIRDGSGDFVSIGVISKTDGEVATINGDYSSVFNYTASFQDGSEMPIKFLRRDEQTGAAYFRLEPRETAEFSAGSFSNSSLQLGQTVVMISGQERNIVTTGLVSDIVGVDQIVINIDVSAIDPGATLLNLSGDVVAILNRQKIFVPVQKLLALDVSENEGTAAAGQAF